MNITNLQMFHKKYLKQRLRFNLCKTDEIRVKPVYAAEWQTRAGEYIPHLSRAGESNGGFKTPMASCEAMGTPEPFGGGAVSGSLLLRGHRLWA